LVALAAVGLARTSADVATAVGKAEQAVAAAEQLCKSLKLLAKNESVLSSIEVKQSAAAQHALASDESLRSALTERFDGAEHATAQALAGNTTDVAEMESDVTKLRNASHDLRAVDRHVDKVVSAAVETVSEEAVEPRHMTSSQAMRAAYVAIDPLYSLGDDAEDVADGLNDRANDAKSCAKEAVHAFAKHLHDQGDHVVHKLTAHLHWEHGAHAQRKEVKHLEAKEHHSVKKEHHIEARVENGARDEPHAQRPPAAQTTMSAQYQQGVRAAKISVTFLLSGFVGSASTLLTIRVISALSSKRSHDLDSPLLVA
jgi:cell fate (sporulation/competence/biofilm development) regulator YlbF (YheA/YmcA/DUF963 family)